MTFLTPDELATLTGRRQRARQIQQLRAMGVAFYVNALGWPVVARRIVEGGPATPAPKASWQPRLVAAGEKR